MNYKEILSSSDVADLNKILPVVLRVHEDSHPELKRVGALYEDIIEGLKVGKNADEMAKAIEELRTVTGDFVPPADACPTFTKSYNLLSKVTDEIR